MNGREPSRELNAWAALLGNPERDHLLDEARRAFESNQQQYSALDSRLVAIVGWAIVGIGTALIAGGLQFNFADSGITAIFVVVGASIAVLAGVFALWPRDLASGLNLSWYSEWEAPSIGMMKARGLAALIHGDNLNRNALTQRHRALQAAVFGLIVEFAALVATLVVQSASG